MKYRYLTIEREYGSGGTRIAQQLAQRLQIPCYGHEIPELICARYGIPPERIERYEEAATGSFLFSIFLMSSAMTGQSESVPQEGQFYLAEQKIIRELASEGPAIFLGHCACEALRGCGTLANVFIRADNVVKTARIEAEYGIALRQAELVRRRYDKKRANYYYANTARHWEDLRNYDMVLDSGRLGVDGCVDALMGLMK